MKSLIVVSDAAPLGDDVMAMAVLAGDGRLNIRLIIATSGNVWASQAAVNARNLLATVGRDIDICVHGPSPALRRRQEAIALEKFGPPTPGYIGAFTSKPPQESAEIAPCRDLFPIIAAADRPDLLVIGPGSPIVSLLDAHPDLSSYVGRVYLMGGAIDGKGNATPAAEFNFWFDPEAAEALLASDLPLTLLPLDVARKLHYSSEFAASLDSESFGAAYVRACAKNTGRLDVCDEALASVLLDHSLVTKNSDLKLAVDTRPGESYGAVIILDFSAERRPVEVIETIDDAKLWLLMRHALANSRAWSKTRTGVI